MALIGLYIVMVSLKATCGYYKCDYITNEIHSNTLTSIKYRCHQKVLFTVKYSDSGNFSEITCHPISNWDYEISAIDEPWVKPRVFLHQCTWTFLEYIFDDVSDTIKNTVNHVTLESKDQNQIVYLPSAIKEIFPSVKILELSHVKIQDSVLQIWPLKLHTLKLFQLKNEILPLLANSSVHHLELDSCKRLHSVTNIKSMEKLKTLIFHGKNQISVLPPSVFQHNPFLTHLTISVQKELKTLTSESFLGLKNLEVFKIYKTPMPTIPSGMLHYYLTNPKLFSCLFWGENQRQKI